MQTHPTATHGLSRSPILAAFHHRPKTPCVAESPILYGPTRLCRNAQAQMNSNRTVNQLEKLKIAAFESQPNVSSLSHSHDYQFKINQ